MRNRHRIEFVFKNAQQKLETVVVTVDGQGSASKVASYAAKIRAALTEVTTFPSRPLWSDHPLAHVRDFPLPSKEQ